MGRNLNDTLAKAFDLAFIRNKAAMYVAGDLPFIKPSDVHSLIQASRSYGKRHLGASPAGWRYQCDSGAPRCALPAKFRKEQL